MNAKNKKIEGLECDQGKSQGTQAIRILEICSFLLLKQFIEFLTSFTILTDRLNIVNPRRQNVKRL